MLGPGFAEKLTGDLVEPGDTSLPIDAAEDVSFGFGADSEEEIVPIGTELEDTGADTSFDTSFNFGFDFGPSEEISTIAPVNATDSDALHGIDAAQFQSVCAGGVEEVCRHRRWRERPRYKMEDEKPAFRKPGDPATLPELIKFLNDGAGIFARLKKRLRRSRSRGSRI